MPVYTQLFSVCHRSAFKNMVYLRGDGWPFAEFPVAIPGAVMGMIRLNKSGRLEVWKTGSTKTLIRQLSTVNCQLMPTLFFCWMNGINRIVVISLSASFHLLCSYLYLLISVSLLMICLLRKDYKIYKFQKRKMHQMRTGRAVKGPNILALVKSEIFTILPGGIK